MELKVDVNTATIIGQKEIMIFALQSQIQQLTAALEKAHEQLAAMTTQNGKDTELIVEK